MRWFSNFLEWRIWAVVGAVIVGLLTALKLSSLRNDSLKVENDNLKQDLEASKAESKIDVINAKNETAYEAAKKRGEREVHNFDVTKPYDLD